MLVATMAEWCANCVVEQNKAKKLFKMLASPDSLVTISLDQDLHEDQPSLRKYVDENGFEKSADALKNTIAPYLSQ